MDERELKSSSLIILCLFIVLHYAKAYWQFLFWHKLCNVLTIWNITQSLSAKYHRSATVFFLSTLDLCGPFVYTARQNEYLFILKIKTNLLVYNLYNNIFFFFFHLTDRGQPSNLTFIYSYVIQR